MKFTVEVEEFYLDSDSGSLDEELKKHVTDSVVDQIQKQIGEKINEEIARVVKAQVENVLLRRISAKVAELIELGTINSDGRNCAPVRIEDFVKAQFESHNGWRSPYEQVAIIAKKWGDELKNRYDKAFAVHIVDAMKKNGLLKDEAIAKLLE